MLLKMNDDLKSDLVMETIKDFFSSSFILLSLYPRIAYHALSCEPPSHRYGQVLCK